MVASSFFAKIIQSMRNISGFNLFYQKMIQLCPENDACQTTLYCNSWVARRKRQIEQSDTTQSSVVKEHFKVIYFETIDAVHDALKERFGQVL